MVTHRCGVMERWGGEVIAGRPINRDRVAEFEATGTVTQLEDLVAAQWRRWAQDLAGYDTSARPVGPDYRDEGGPR